MKELSNKNEKMKASGNFAISNNEILKNYRRVNFLNLSLDRSITPLLYASFIHKVGFLLIFVCHFTVKAQRSEVFSTTASSAALGGGISTVENAAAVFTNGVQLLAKTQLAVVANAEVKWNSYEFQSIGLGFVYAKAQESAVGISIQKLGIEQAHFFKIGATYARQLNDANNISVNFYYNAWRVQNYPNSGNISYAICYKFALSEKIAFGVHVWNIIPYRINSFEFIQPQCRFFLQARINDALKISIENHFNLDNNRDVFASHGVNIGLAYLPIKNLEVRSGISTSPTFFSLGCAVQLSKKNIVEIGTSSYSALGFSPAVSYSQGF